MAYVVEPNLARPAATREEALAATHARAKLKMDFLWSDRDPDRPKKAVHADLQPMKLETLYRARVERWFGTSILLSGW